MAGYTKIPEASMITTYTRRNPGQGHYPEPSGRPWYSDCKKYITASRSALGLLGKERFMKLLYPAIFYPCRRKERLHCRCPWSSGLCVGRRFFGRRYFDGHRCCLRLAARWTRGGKPLTEGIGGQRHSPRSRRHRQSAAFRYGHLRTKIRHKCGTQESYDSGVHEYLYWKAWFEFIQNRTRCDQCENASLKKSAQRRFLLRGFYFRKLQCNNKEEIKNRMRCKKLQHQWYRHLLILRRSSQWSSQQSSRRPR